MSLILDHIVLNVEDVDAAVRFYRDVVGFDIERLDEFHAGSVPFPSARINAGTLIDLFPPKMWKAVESVAGKLRNLNHFCLALDLVEWDALRERLAANGIVIFKDRTLNFGAKGEGVSMYFLDPDANEIEARFYASI